MEGGHKLEVALQLLFSCSVDLFCWLILTGYVKCLGREDACCNAPVAGESPVIVQELTALRILLKENVLNVAVVCLAQSEGSLFP